MYTIGIDIGGTDIKCGIADGEGNIVTKGKAAADAHLGAERTIQKAAELAETLCAEAGISMRGIAGAGAGIPGIIDPGRGMVVYNNNLGWRRVKFSKLLKERLKIPVYIGNDANVAALGEAEYGAGRDYKDIVMVTLGTGLGGGIISDGKILDGNKGAGAELGHMVLHTGGEKCTCGRRGCFEAYCSATALIRMTRKQMEKDAQSPMWAACDGDAGKIGGKTAFRFYREDAGAKKVVDKYIKLLAVGLANYANIFRPEAIVIGGGISNEGQFLLDLLEPKFKKQVYGKNLGPKVVLRLAELRNDAGFLGAAALARQNTLK
jgi:glucokinase